MMDKQLKEATLAVLHNNEIIMQQTEDINTERGDDNRVLGNMRKIYDGVREKNKQRWRRTYFCRL